MPIGGYSIIQPILTSAARTSSGQSSVFNVQEFSRITFYANITAASGDASPQLTVKIEESPDQSNYYDIPGLEDSIDTTGQLRLTTDEHTKYIRVNYTISGTNPSFTFTIDMAGRY